MFKNQLQELAQRSCFNFPSYACIREGPDHAPRFKATVNFNSEVFESPTFCNTLRQAEHSAAEAALDQLSKKGPSKALAAKVLDETGVYKNILQETTHKAGLRLPVYTTIRSGPNHVALFSCTVELAGMSFKGESAKTKKQAEKYAAIAAWTALKKMARSSSSVSSSSSSPALVDPVLNDEREQNLVSRYLATLRPQKINRANQNNRQSDLGRSGMVMREMIPICDGTMQNQTWVYPCVYQNRPQFLPLIRSLFQPNYAQYFQVVPELGPFVYLPNISQLTVQEIEGNRQSEENWLHNSSNSHCRPINFQSNPSGSSPVEVSNHNPLTYHYDLIIPEMLLENTEKPPLPSAPTTGKSVQFEAPQAEQNISVSSPTCMDSPFGSQANRSDNDKLRLQNHLKLDYLQCNHRPYVENSIGFPRDYRPPPSSVAPVALRTSNAALSGHTRPENSHNLAPAPPLRRATVSGYSTRPSRGGIRSIGCNPANFMAPAVHIRSVVPVCSSPPAKTVSPRSQLKLLSGSGSSQTDQPDGTTSATSRTDQSREA